MKILKNRLLWFIIGLGLATFGIALANNLSILNSIQKGDLTTGLTTGNYQLLHPGANGTLLVASSTSANGLSFQTPTSTIGSAFVTVGPAGSKADYIVSGTNDNVVINQATAAVDSSGGGTVYLKTGTYHICSGSVKVYGDSILEGSGEESTTLYLDNGCNVNVISSLASSSVYFTKIQDLTVDGNSTNNTTGDGIDGLYAHTWQIEHVHVKNTPQRGIYFHGDGTYQALNNRVAFSRVENTTNECILAGAFAPNNHFISNILGGSINYDCMSLQNDENTVIGNHVHTSALNGIYLGGKNNIVDANLVESSKHNGIYVAAGFSGNRVTNNETFNNGEDTTTPYSGIDIAGDETSVIGNHAFDRKTPKTQSYGISIESTASNTDLLDNNVLSINELISAYHIATSTIADDSILAPVAGSFGIGTTTPQATLNVQGYGNLNPFTVSSSSGTSLLNIDPHGNAIFLGDTTSGTGALLNVATSSSFSIFDVLANGNVGIGTNTPANLFVVANAGTNLLNVQQSGDMLWGATPTTNGAFVYKPSNTGNPYFGIYSGGTVFGIGTQLPGPAGTSLLGGYYHGLGISGTSNSGDNPIFGILNSTQGGNGLGNTAFTILDTNKVYTFNNTLDDGSGSMNIAKNLTVVATSTLATTTATKLTVSNLTSGNCVQASTGGLLTTAAAPCSSGGSGNSAWTIGNTLIYNATSTDSVLIGTSTPVTANLFVQGTGSKNPFNVASSSGSSLLIVTSGGNIGVNSSTPVSRLSIVAPSTDATGIIINAANGGDNDTAFQIQNSVSLWQFSVRNTPDSISKGFGFYGSTNGGSSYTNPLALTATGAVQFPNLSTNALTYTDGSKNLANITLGTGLSLTGSTLNATNAFTGSGTNGQVAYWTSSTALTSSASLLNNGTVIGINASSSTINLNVQGTTTLDPFNVSSSSGTSILRVTSGGNVGIGTSTPATKLVIQGSGSATDILTIASSTGASLITMGVNSNGVQFGINTTTGTSIINVVGNASNSTFSLLNLQGTSGGTGNLFQLSSSTGTTLLVFDSKGHLGFGGAQPVLSSCGTSPSLSSDSTDVSGTITVGSVSATACTLTFATARTNSPHCNITNQSMSVVNAMTYTVSTTAFTVTMTGLTGDKLDYNCTGN